MGKGNRHSPAYKVEVNGVNQSGLLKERLIELAITLSAGGSSDTLSLKLDDSDSRKRLTVPLLEQDTIKVWLGYETKLQDMGTFLVDSVTLAGGSGSADNYSIEARAIDTAGNMFDRKYKIWKAEKKGEKIKLSQIVGKIASDNNLSYAISPELKSVSLEREIQRLESDISFLRSLAQRNSAMVKFSGGKLLFLVRKSQSVSGKVIPPKKIAVTDIKNWMLSFGNRWCFKNFIGEWWDDTEARLKRERVANPGADTAKDYVLNKVWSSAAEAREEAQKKLSELEVKSNRLSLELVGDPELRPLTPLIISGVRSQVNGKWLVGDVTHTLSSSGYSTSLKNMRER